MPSPLPDNSIAPLSGERVERFGFSFQLPWKQTASEHTLQDAAYWSFGDEGTITVQDPASRFDSAKLRRTFANATPLLNRQAFSSDCALTSAALKATPDQVKWWKTRGQNAKDLNLLVMKMMIRPPGHGALYVLSFPGMCGVQQGSPSAAPYRVNLNLFDKADRHYEIEIYQGRPHLTEAQINAIIASIRSTPQN